MMKSHWRYGSLLLIFVLAAVGITQRDLFAETKMSGQVTTCVDGLAGPYPCHNVDMLAHLSLAELGAGEGVKGNDHWGWTDPDTGRDFVIFGLTNGTVFVEMTDRLNPQVLGTLPAHDGESIWRDIKVYQNFAYITADINIDGSPSTHGLQLFDLTQLLTVNNPPFEFAETSHYDQFGPGHNLWINEESGFLYVFRSDTCNAEIHMVNIQNPAVPVFAGCFAVDDAPLSDSECVMYRGPDVDYIGREICFTGSDDNVTIGDVTDKNNPELISDFVYDGIARAHQGALTWDQRYWLLSDTMDEEVSGYNTRTYVIDVLDLDKPKIVGFYEHSTTARDHNVYISEGIAYETNWRAGLRVLNLMSLPHTQFLEVGYFDIVPDNDSIAASGAWSNYPWWDDGVVTVSGTDEGLFILQPTIPKQHLPLITMD
ncbi:MAG: choice-of-anchor B family protein [Candidatus Promineifilaceae bacterium]|nr:choice-of-anchor B family protein [Candidatus Promineifilaceae bacterium]